MALKGFETWEKFMIEDLFIYYIVVLWLDLHITLHDIGIIKN